MARRDRTAEAPVTESSDSTDTVLTEETPVSATTEEAPVVEATDTDVPTQAEAPATDEAAKPEKKEIDLTALSEATAAALEQRDTSTGDLPEVAIAPVVTAYRALDGIAAKNKAKAFVIEQMREAMNALDAVKARSFMILQEHLSAGAGTTSTPRQPADPTKNYVERVAGIKLALALVGTVRPENAAEDAEEQADALYGEVYNQAEAYLAWSSSDAADKGEEPVDVPAFVKAAVKLAQGKSAKVGGRATGGGTGTGERHDIGEHIRQAFEDLDSGSYLSIAQIRAHKSSEYGDNPPSAGAISARLFPNSGKCSLDFVTPATDADGKRGATKN